MNDAKSGAGDWNARTKRNTMRLGYWTGAWVVTLAIAVFGPLFAWKRRQFRWP